MHSHFLCLRFGLALAWTGFTQALGQRESRCHVCLCPQIACLASVLRLSSRRISDRRFIGQLLLTAKNNYFSDAHLRRNDVVITNYVARTVCYGKFTSSTVIVTVNIISLCHSQTPRLKPYLPAFDIRVANATARARQGQTDTVAYTTNLCSFWSPPCWRWDSSRTGSWSRRWGWGWRWRWSGSRCWR